MDEQALQRSEGRTDPDGEHDGNDDPGVGHLHRHDPGDGGRRADRQVELSGDDRHRNRQRPQPEEREPFEDREDVVRGSEAGVERGEEEERGSEEEQPGREDGIDPSRSGGQAESSG